MKLPHTLLIACLGAAPLWAQQVEPAAEAPKPATTPSGGMAQPEQKPVAYIGVLTREVPAELRAQFSLAEGFGLLVEEVLPDSPAKAAGLKVYDVLVKFEDQQLVNMEQLMSLVRTKKKGDVVHLDVISGGKETQVPVTLGEHLIAAHDNPLNNPRYRGEMEHPNGMPGFNHDMFRSGEQRGFQNQGNAMQEQMERLQHLQQELREYQERVQQWSKGGSTGPMPQMPEADLRGRRRSGHPPQTGISIPPGIDVEKFMLSQSQTAANVTQRDDSGEYTLKNEDGKKTFIARPNNGQEQSWPVNTDAERQAVPPEFRDRLRKMDGAGSGGSHIEINPGPRGNVPGNPPALPPVKAKTTSAFRQEHKNGDSSLSHRRLVTIN